MLSQDERKSIAVTLGRLCVRDPARRKHLKRIVLADPERYALEALEVAIELGQPVALGFEELIAEGGTEQRAVQRVIDSIRAALPWPTVELRKLSLDIMMRDLGSSLDTGPDAKDDPVRRLLNYGVRQIEVDDHRSALAINSEALLLMRETGEFESAWQRPVDLLINMMVSQTEVGEIDNAIETWQIAKAKLMRIGRDERGLEYAARRGRVDSSAALALHRNGQLAEAIRVSRHARRFFQHLVMTENTNFRLEQARVEINLARSLAAMQRKEEASAMITGAIRLARRGVEDEYDKYLPTLAIGLECSCEIHRSLRNPQVALRNSEEALELYEDLYCRGVPGFEMRYAAASANHAVYLLDSDSVENRSTWTSRAVSILEELAKQGHRDVGEALAISYVSHAGALAEQDRDDAALEALRNAEHRFRSMQSVAAKLQLAGVLANQSLIVEEQGDMTRVMALREEAVGIVRALGETERGYIPGVADAVLNACSDD